MPKRVCPWRADLCIHVHMHVHGCVSSHVPVGSEGTSPLCLGLFNLSEVIRKWIQIQRCREPSILGRFSNQSQSVASLDASVFPHGTIQGLSLLKKRTKLFRESIPNSYHSSPPPS